MNYHRVLGAWLLLLALTLPAVPVHADAPQWLAATTTATTILPSGDLALAADAAPAAAVYGAYARWGQFDSQPLVASPFVRVHVHWNADVPAGASLRVDLRAADRANRWSDWTLDVASDTIVPFDRASVQVQYRLTLLANQTSPQVHAVQISPLPLNDADVTVGSLDQRVAPTYHIRATRMGLVGERTANGHIIQPNDWFVSLPSFRSLSSKGGSEYMARLSYGGKSVVVPVWEVGPWNIHDDYWNVDRERFADLPVGWPEDHAAYFDGYNGGRAEKGRVRFPTAADVGDGAWVALGIPFNEEQEQLDITFLWLGTDPGANPTPQAPGSSQPAAPPPPADAPGTIIVDDLAAGFARSTATWYEFNCGYGDHVFWTYSTPDPAKATNNATWTTKLAAGTYEVSVHVPYCRNGKSDTTSAAYIVSAAGGDTRVKVNQAATAGSWVSLGQYAFSSSGSVSLSDLTDDSMNAVWFDAVKWIPVGP